MPIHTDNSPQPLYGFNQLLNGERAQIVTPRWAGIPDSAAPRYFLWHGRVYDTADFPNVYDGLWQGVFMGLVIQLTPDKRFVIVGVVTEFDAVRENNNIGTIDCVVGGKVERRRIAAFDKAKGGYFVASPELYPDEKVVTFIGDPRPHIVKG